MDVDVRCSVTARKENLQFRNQITSFAFDFVTAAPKGPTPDYVSVPVTGLDVTFPLLTDGGGICVISNLDDTHYIEYGVWNGAVYLPLGECLPGESYIVRTSRRLQAGPGTGNLGNLRLYAFGGTCRVRVEALDP